MIIFRYLLKEVFITLVALTTMLLLIFMSNQCVQYLSRAANGQIPGLFVFKLMMLELPNLTALLLPLGFYMAIMLSYGRLYAENEITAMYVGGYSPRRLMRQTLAMGMMVALFVGLLVFYVSPWISYERARLLKTTGVKVLIQTLSPGQFRSLNDGKVVFYSQGISRNHETAKGVFIAKRLPNDQWQVVWANAADGQTNPKTKEDELVLSDGYAYIGTPGQAKYQVIRYHQANIRLPHSNSNPEKDIRTASFKSLWPYFNSDKNKAAELQWRISIPLMVLVLTFVAVPLSRVQLRSGKYANLLPAILIYVLYANFMFVARNWVVIGRVPVWLGMWWLHLAVIGLACLLLWRNHRRFS